MLEPATTEQRCQASDQPHPASVIAIDPKARRVQVQPLADGPEHRLWCRMAVPGLEGLSPGDEVLVTGSVERGAYVIGILASSGAGSAPDCSELRLPGGAHAVAVDDTHLRLHAEDGRLLFEYDAASGRVCLHAPAGGLEIAGGEGDIAIRTGGDLRLDAQTVHVTGRLGVRLAVADPAGRAVSGFMLGHRGAHLFGAALEVLARQAKLVAREFTCQGGRLKATLKHLQVTAERVESTAQTVIERARNVYRTVSELSQLRAGRQRTVIEEGAHLQAGKLDFRARADVSIDGERIHLG